MFLTRELTHEEELRAQDLHRRAIVIDTLGALRPTQEYIDRLRVGGVTALGLTLVAESHNFREAVNWIAWWNKELLKWSHDLVLATSAADIRQAKEDGRVAVIYLFQNGKPFEEELGYVELFRRMGVTSSQLTYQMRNYIGEGSSEPTNAGLSLYGREVVKEMNRVRMLVDLSHAGVQTVHDAIQMSARPPYFSHACVSGVHPSVRNVSDETLALLKEKGGLLSPTGLHISADIQPTVCQMMDHVTYALDKLGPDHVGISTDYLKAPDKVYRDAYIDENGFLHLEYEGTLKAQLYDWRNKPVREYPWFIYPQGLETYREMPNITRELVARGLSDEVILNVLGGNYLRLYEEVVG